MGSCYITQGAQLVFCDSRDGLGAGGRFTWKETHVYLWLTHTVVSQKQRQQCKAIIFQLKKKKKKELHHRRLLWLSSGSDAMLPMLGAQV